jgi:hypothetical protein
LNKQEFFLEAIKNQAYLYFDVMSSIFLEMRPEDVEERDYSVSLRDGVYHYYLDGEWHPISDGKYDGGPLLEYVHPKKDRFKLKPNTFINQKEAVDTCAGNIYFNALVLTHWFKDTIDFPVHVDIEEIEAQIADRLIDDPEDKDTPPPPGKIYVWQMIESLSAAQTLEALGPYVVVAGTEKNIQPPPDMESLKKKLLKEYGDRLKDPVVQVEFITRLQDHYREYLKDDPSMGVLVSGKVFHTALTKMFIAAGVENNFTAELSEYFLSKSYSEGSDHSTEDHAAIQSSVRYGSFGRGALTALGGVYSSDMIGLFTSIHVSDDDCGTKKTKLYDIDETNKRSFIGRYTSNGKPLTVSDVDGLVGKSVKLRTPLYCKYPKEHTCKHCAGEVLFRAKESLAQTAAELALVVMYSYFAIIKGEPKIARQLDVDKFIV